MISVRPASSTAGQLAGRSIEIINTGRADLAAQVYGPRFVTVDPHGHDHGPEGVCEGPEVFANIVGYLHGMFADLHLDIRLVRHRFLENDAEFERQIG
ncbi:MAG: hypothetical protein JOZ47_06620 [Kutzneria sp.]|nr:hypothetical protein [Kutzneria sp.]